MLHKDFDPITVMKFDRDALAFFIRESAGGMQINEIDGKTQIEYLHKYLRNSAHIKAKTIVVESQYVDRHYLEDYSQYYARCFKEYPRTCSRIHFFKDKFEHHDFLKSLANNDTKFLRDLEDGYLGFVVIRPIPHTFLGRLCIAPYTELVENDLYKVIKLKNSVSLFGVQLKVETAPFVEKDKVVAKCATSAIWTLLATSLELKHGSSPSLSSITKAAETINEGVRTFPTESFTPIQITRSLRYFGLEPNTYYLSDNINIKELVYAYVKNEIPILVGGTVYREKGGKICVEGDHLVCALGYRLGGSIEHQEKDLSLNSSKIDRLYVHDDRYGPYVSWSESRILVEGIDGKEEVVAWEYGLKNEDDSLDSTHVEYFVPDIAICGNNHKIRIPYTEVYDSCLAFSAYIEEDLEVFKRESGIDKEMIESIDRTLKCSWSIFLTYSANYKDSLISCGKFKLFNGAVDKNSILLKNLPKHIWIARLEDEKGLFMDIVFDATEVPQGNILVGFVVYSSIADTAIRFTEAIVKSRVWSIYNFPDESKINIRPFVSFFNEIPNRQSLNIKYGSLSTPFRGLDKFEKDDTNNTIRRDTITIREGGSSTQWKSLIVEGKKYIWVVDMYGDLVIGVESENKKQGHPTLIDGRPARLGGQLNFNKEEKLWVIDLFSGAYSRHLEKPSELANAYLNNVIENFMNGLDVKPNYGDPKKQRVSA